MTKQRRACAVVAMAAMAGCWSELPPPAAPSRVMPTPATEIGPPPAGTTTVLFDADRPAQVSEVDGATSRPICLMPCATHLARGAHRLVFHPAGLRSWAGDGEVQVGEVPIAYRYALGHRNPRIGARVGGWILFAAGMGLVATGVVYWAIGDSGDRIGEIRTTNFKTIGQVETFVGAGVALAGAIMLATMRPEIQPGTGVQWDLANAAPGMQARP